MTEIQSKIKRNVLLISVEWRNMEYFFIGIQYVLKGYISLISVRFRYIKYFDEDSVIQLAINRKFVLISA